MSPGSIVGGYKVIGVIGVGGMAVVYRAEQISLRRPVALKVLSKSLANDEAFRERFRLEGTNIAALDHPNIVPIYDSGEADGELFLAMRLVEGTTLSERMQNRALNADAVVSVLNPIGDALDFAHASGLVHRDVKPQNILLSRQGHPYLADFGVAKAAQGMGLTATGGFVGSFHYAAPEQVLGRPIAPTTDVYALAAVLYECLSGEVPYPRDTEAGVLQAQISEPPPRLSAVGPEAEALNAVIARGMAKEPGDRYQTASALLDDVRNVLVDLTFAERHRAPVFARDTHVLGSSRGSSAQVTRAPSQGDEQVTRASTRVERPATVPAREFVGEAPAPRAVRADPADRDGTVLVDERQLRDPTPAVEATVVDPRRRAPTSGSAGTEPKPRRRITRLLLAVSVLLGALAVLAVMLVGSGHRRVVTARSGIVTLRFTSPWRSSGRSVSPLFAGAAAAAPLRLDSPAGTTLLAGALADPADIPGEVSGALVKSYGQPSATSHPVVAGAPGTLARWRSHGRTVVVYIAPTSASDIAFICEGDAPASLRQCGRISETADISGATRISLGPDAEVAARMNTILAPVTVLRTSRKLDHGSLAARGKAAAVLATAELRATAKLGGLSAPVRYHRAISTLIGAVRVEAGVLRRLADAGEAKSRRRYVAAAAAFGRSGRSLLAASHALASYGLTLRGLAEFDIAPPRVVTATPVPTTNRSTEAAPSAPAAESSPPAYVPPAAPSEPAPAPVVTTPFS